jgi:hypothetical protein
VQLLAAGDPFQLALLTVHKLQSGPGNKIGYRARDEDFSWLGECRYALGDVNSYAADVVVGDLDFTGVKSASDLDS